MIIFVGSNPSISAGTTVPFQNCRSGSILRSWISQMGLEINDCILANISDTPTPGNRPLTKKEVLAEIPRLRSTLSGKTVVSLGKTAHEALAMAGIEHHSLPHPSGLNRLINNKEWLAGELARVASAIKEPSSQQP